MAWFSSSTMVFITSLLWMPICFLCNYVHKHFSDELAAACIASFFAILMICVHLCREKAENFSKIYYVFAASSFLSVTNLLIGLENDDFIAGYVDFYVDQAEPYLKTAHGTITSYWDGVVHYGMYLTMLAAMSWGQSFREVGMVWCGSVINSMLVILPAHLLGRQHMFLLPLCINVPFLLIAIVILGRLMREPCPSVETPVVLSDSDVAVHHVGLWRRPADVVGIILSLASLVLHLFRGAAALNLAESSESIFNNYTNRVEPYINDPVLFPKVELLLYLFYMVPYLVCCLHALTFPGARWLFDWSLVFLGAAGQGQFVHVCSALHMRTPYIYRIRTNGLRLALFWGGNLLTLLTPLYLTIRCHNNPEFFTPAVLGSQSRGPCKKRSVVQNPYLRRVSVNDKKDS